MQQRVDSKMLAKDEGWGTLHAYFNFKPTSDWEGEEWGGELAVDFEVDGSLPLKWRLLLLAALMFSLAMWIR